jgi:phosphomannomutase
MIYLFDIDGTLTPPRQRMEHHTLYEFLGWAPGKKFFLVAGSDFVKVREQIPGSILDRSEGVFCCMGNEFRRENKIVYQNEFNPPAALREMLVSHQMHGGFPVKVKAGGRGDIFEFRTGMLNFTTIGRNAGTEERNKYYEWDKEHKERERIANEIEEKFPELEARLGGQISIDIQPKGNNKSQASKWVRENLREEMYFFGDKCEEGGNDYDIALDITKNKDGMVFQVKDHKDTTRSLKRIESGEIRFSQ